jgi:hypothetical protein
MYQYHQKESFVDLTCMPRGNPKKSALLRIKRVFICTLSLDREMGIECLEGKLYCIKCTQIHPTFPREEGLI